jgi:hypothetical protein
MFNSHPPSKKSHLPHLLRIKAGQTLISRIAGNPVRTNTHFFKGRTYPCIGSPTMTCPLCEHVSNPRYYAYWPIRGSTGMAAAVELTESAELQLLEVLPDDAPPLGVLVQFHRPSGRRNNPVEVSIPYLRSNADDIIASTCKPVDEAVIRATLLRLWGCPERGESQSEADYQSVLLRLLSARYTRMCLPNESEGSESAA